MRLAPKKTFTVLTFSFSWLLVWSLTHGFFMNDQLMGLLPGNSNQKYLVASTYISGIILISMFILPEIRKKNLPKSKLIYLYLIPLLLIIALPFHYSLALNPLVYITMITISCFWQDYLTFGIYQTKLIHKYNKLTVVPIVAIFFFMGHFVFYLDSLSEQTLFGWIMIAVAGLVLAAARYKSGNIYISNVIHLSFLLLVV